MADYDSFKPTIGSLDYPSKYDQLVSATEAVAVEVENARQGAATLVANLNTYAKYILTDDIDGGAIWGTADSGLDNTTLTATGYDFSGVAIGSVVVNASSDPVAYATVESITPTPPYDTITTSDAGTPWTDSLFSIGGFKAINMGVASANSNDYATVSYLDSLTATSTTEIAQLGIGSLSANDILAIDPSGTAIIGKPAAFGAIRTTSDPPGTYRSVNENIAFSVSGTLTLRLPTGTGSDGATIKFSDVNGTIDSGGVNTLVIVPFTGQKIMGQAVDTTLVVSHYPYISFDLVWVEAASSWYIKNLQR